jgi:hypothetical protein
MFWRRAEIGYPRLRMRARAALLLSFAIALAAPPALAEDAIAEARESFKQGNALAKDGRWAEALASFERSAKLRPHSWTTYNIAVCERALGRYVRARRAFERTLAENKERGGTEIPETTAAEVRGYLGEIERILATAEVTLDPPSASITVDGQPLTELATSDSRPLLLAGAEPPGPGKPPPAASFRVVLDPGAHVFVLSRKGFSDAIHRETFRPGATTRLDLNLEKLPAVLRIKADRKDAAVSVDGVDVGIAPVTISRPAGRVHVVVRKQGFVRYEVDADAQPGEEVDLLAALKPEKPSVVTRWWFWTAAGVVVTAAVIGTYAATRPPAERPPLDGGGLGWTVRVP